jgi:hypothetical protein
MGSIASSIVAYSWAARNHLGTAVMDWYYSLNSVGANTNLP